MAYSNFADNTTPIQFFYGVQSDLTPFIKGEAKGTAPNQTYCIEGAFYLATDTQKLYVGRKNSTDNKIYAVQVSRGVTFVTSAHDLPTPTANEIEEGELYYITSENVLAALVYDATLNNNNGGYKWTQINPPTGITAVEGNATAETDGSSNPTGNVIINSLIKTDGGNNTGKTKLVAGSNITLTANGQETIDGIKTAKVTIAATDTTYTLGTEATASGATDGATIELAINGNAADTNNTKINITGSGTVAVTSDASGNIDVHGPTFNSMSVIPYETGNASNKTGFVVSLNGTNGDGAAFSASGDHDPAIVIGAVEQEVHFLDGIADLDVYTIDETDAKIADEIKKKLATANAMTYCGTVAPSSDKTFAQVFREKVIANGGAHNGDVYKIAGLDSSVSTIDGMTPDVGDLIIITGTEETTGEFAGQIKVGNTGVTGTSGNYSATNDYTANGLINLCNLVPSGDEPQVEAVTTASATNSNASSIVLRDGKNNNANILTTTIVGDNKVEVTSTKTTGGTGDNLAITVKHASGDRAAYDASTHPNGDRNNLSLISNTNNASDTIGTDKYDLFVLNDYDGLKTDSYGHVLGLQGKKITFQHNRLTKLVSTYGTGTSSGLITLNATDTIGGSTTILGSSNVANIHLISDTLKLDGNDTNKELSINLVWHAF